MTESLKEYSPTEKIMSFHALIFTNLTSSVVFVLCHRCTPVIVVVLVVVVILII